MAHRIVRGSKRKSGQVEGAPLLAHDEDSGQSGLNPLSGRAGTGPEAGTGAAGRVFNATVRAVKSMSASSAVSASSSPSAVVTPPAARAPTSSSLPSQRSRAVKGGAVGPRVRGAFDASAHEDEPLLPSEAQDPVTDAAPSPPPPPPPRPAPTSAARRPPLWAPKHPVEALPARGGGLGRAFNSTVRGSKSLTASMVAHAHPTSWSPPPPRVAEAPQAPRQLKGLALRELSTSAQGLRGAKGAAAAGLRPAAPPSATLTALSSQVPKRSVGSLPAGTVASGRAFNPKVCRLKSLSVSTMLNSPTLPPPPPPPAQLRAFDSTPPAAAAAAPQSLLPPECPNGAARGEELPVPSLPAPTPMLRPARPPPPPPPPRPAVPRASPAARSVEASPRPAEPLPRPTDLLTSSAGQLARRRQQLLMVQRIAAEEYLTVVPAVRGVAAEELALEDLAAALAVKRETGAQRNPAAVEVAGPGGGSSGGNGCEEEVEVEVEREHMSGLQQPEQAQDQEAGQEQPGRTQESGPCGAAVETVALGMERTIHVDVGVVVARKGDGSSDGGAFHTHTTPQSPREPPYKLQPTLPVPRTSPALAALVPGRRYVDASTFATASRPAPSATPGPATNTPSGPPGPGTPGPGSERASTAIRTDTPGPATASTSGAATTSLSTHSTASPERQEARSALLFGSADDKDGGTRSGKHPAPFSILAFAAWDMAKDRRAADGAAVGHGSRPSSSHGSAKGGLGAYLAARLALRGRSVANRAAVAAETVPREVTGAGPGKGVAGGAGQGEGQGQGEGGETQAPAREQSSEGGRDGRKRQWGLLQCCSAPEVR